jgi:hypothetical protein
VNTLLSYLVHYVSVNRGWTDAFTAKVLLYTAILAAAVLVVSRFFWGWRARVYRAIRDQHLTTVDAYLRRWDARVAAQPRPTWDDWSGDSARLVPRHDLSDPILDLLQTHPTPNAMSAVAIVGPANSGRTVLALEVARRWRGGTPERNGWLGRVRDRWAALASGPALHTTIAEVSDAAEFAAAIGALERYLYLVLPRDLLPHRPLVLIRDVDRDYPKWRALLPELARLRLSVLFTLHSSVRGDGDDDLAGLDLFESVRDTLTKDFPPLGTEGASEAGRARVVLGRNAFDALARELIVRRMGHAAPEDLQSLARRLDGYAAGNVFLFAAALDEIRKSAARGTTPTRPAVHKAIARSCAVNAERRILERLGDDRTKAALPPLIACSILYAPVAMPVLGRFLSEALSLDASAIEDLVETGDVARSYPVDLAYYSVLPNAYASVLAEAVRQGAWAPGAAEVRSRACQLLVDQPPGASPLEAVLWEAYLLWLDRADQVLPWTWLARVCWPEAHRLPPPNWKGLPGIRNVVHYVMSRGVPRPLPSPEKNILTPPLKTDFLVRNPLARLGGGWLTAAARAGGALTQCLDRRAPWLIRDEDELVRVGACVIAAWAAGDESMTALGRVLSDDPSPQARFAAGVALDKTTGDTPLRPCSADIMWSLIAGLGDPEEAVQAVAARVLGAAGQAAAENPLIQLLLSDDRAEWPRAEAAQALARIGCTRAAPLAARVGRQAALSGLPTLWVHADWAAAALRRLP